MTDADGLRRTFTDFFVQRGHVAVPSAGLIPHHPTAPLFTNAGMNQFVSYFLGEEPAPWPRAASVQKCVRLSGKHNDVDELGRTRRHLSFFEMLGNFSFGDYFKDRAIPLAWELLTEVAGFDGDRLWITVHETDDEAEAIWHEAVGVPLGRIQRLGKDNFWEMGETGPCGPCSEIHLDCGPEWGEEGGPAHGGGDRYVEFWNLVFMQYFRHPDGSLTDLPKKNVDTGGGLERWLMLLDDVPTVFDTQALRPLVSAAESLTGRRYGAGDRAADVALRVLGDHARTVTFLVNDGVTPSNEDRGYVLRSVIRRAVRRAYQLGVERPVLATLVEAVVDVMGDAYPELRQNGSSIADVADREEARFRQTLRSGSQLLEEELETGRVRGEVAFKLHDTFGFPIEITQEIAAERGVAVDRPGFDEAMERQRRRAKESRRTEIAGGRGAEDYREVLARSGPTEFTGYAEHESKGHVVAVLPGAEGRLEVFLDRTPFYAESGGQVGDTGTIVADGATARVLDTTFALPGLRRHVVDSVEGRLAPGQEATATVDAERRERIRRNHTGTHLLHWALREVLGSHAKQHGSLVAPDYLHFDFSHHSQLGEEQLARIEALVNEQVLANDPVRAYETSREHAEQLGALAFFGEKYGEFVRVVEAGRRSIELCGGTHVGALGNVGPVTVVSEGSIGSNLRRVLALTGDASFGHLRSRDRLVRRAAQLLRATPDELPDAVERALDRQRTLERELKALRGDLARAEAAALAAAAVDGIVVARRDGLGADQLRQVAEAVRSQPGVRAVVLAGSPDGERVALVAAVAKGSGIPAGELVAEAARQVGGGGGGKGDLATAGGRDPSRIDDALALVRARLGVAGP